MKEYYLDERGSQFSRRATIVRAICKRTRKVIAEATHTVVLNNRDEVLAEVMQLAEWQGYSRTYPPKRKPFKLTE